MSVSELEHPSTTSTAATEDALFQRLSEWLGQRVEAPLDLVCLEEAGLEPALIDRLMDAGFTRPDLTWVIPTRTLAHRKQRNEPLGQGESARLLRLLHLVALAEAVFAHPEKAQAWLYRPLRRFAGRRPLDLVQTESGAELAEEALWQLDEGLFV